MLPKNLFLAAGLCLLVCAVLFLGFLEEDEFESPTIPAPPISLIQNGNWPNPTAPAMQQKLINASNDWKNLGTVTARSVAVSSGDWGHWHSDANLEKSPRFWWASVGKTVTSILTLQLIEDEKLSLDAAASKFFPALPQQLTIAHLLHHTPGLGGFEQLSWAQNQTSLIDRDELLHLAIEAETLFDVGEGWAYSNIGYLILAEILEQVSGISFSELVAQRIATPLQLQSLAALEGHLPSDVIFPELPRPITATDYAPNISGAGGIVSNAQDMASFWRAVMSGQLVSGQTLNQGQSQAHTFFDNNTMMMMGAGHITYVGSQNHGFWFGHGGGSTQVDALLVYSPSKKLIIAIAGIGQKVSAFDILNAIVQTLEAE